MQHFLQLLCLFKVIKVKLTSASNGGNLGADTSINIIVPANDNPYGTVYFQQSVYLVQEPLEGVYTANITVNRGYSMLYYGFSLIEWLFTSFICLFPLLQKWSLWTFGDPVQHL